LGGAIAPPVGFAFDELAEILDVGALLVGSLLGQLAVVLGDKIELQVIEMRVEIIGCQSQGQLGFRHDGNLLLPIRPIDFLKT
jgi:hypothetical protein